jgi:hypothetical protein
MEPGPGLLCSTRDLDRRRFRLCNRFINRRVDMVTDLIILNNLSTLIMGLTDADIQTIESRKIPTNLKDMFQNLKYILKCQRT